MDLNAKPWIRIIDQPSFMKDDLNCNAQFVVSIQDRGDSGNVLRPDFTGYRLNLYFDDVYDEERGARPEDIKRLLEFSRQWRNSARTDPWLARMIIHCWAGHSRSAACAMMPLSLWYSNFREAATDLYARASYLTPNVRILYLIGEVLGETWGKKYTSNILEDVLNGEMDFRRKQWDKIAKDGKFPGPTSKRD